MAPQPNTAMTPQVETPAKPLSALATRVKAQMEEASKKAARYGSVPAEMRQDGPGDGVYLMFDPIDFVNGIGKSESGKTEGANLIVSGEFVVTIDGLGEVTYICQGRLPLQARVKVEQNL